MSDGFQPLAAGEHATTEVMPEPDEWIGRVIGNRYRIEERLAEGGMGTVFIAEHLTLGKQVALKTIHPRFSDDESLAERFAREAMATAKLDHPHVASAMDYGKLDDGGAYLVMQLVRGPSLMDIMERDGKLPWPRVCSLGAQIADALAAAHSEGIVHRDLKPENVLIEPRDDGSELVKVLDFGIAALVGDAAGPRPSAAQLGEIPRNALTRRGMVVGTPGYMAPEQALGEPIDHRTDLYSLGILLWEGIVGRALFDGETLSEIVREQSEDDAIPALIEASGDPYVPETLQRLVVQLLRYERDTRPSNAAYVRDTLRRLTLEASVGGRVTPPMGSLTARVDPSTTPTIDITTSRGKSDATPPANKRSLVMGLMATAVLALVVAGVIWLVRRPPEPVATGPSVEQVAELVAQARAATQTEELRRQEGLLLHEQSRDVRRAAATYVLDFEPADQVSGWIRAVAQLEHAMGCHAIRAALAQIRENPHVGARGPVERLHRASRRGRGRRTYRCVSGDLRDTLEVLPEEEPEGEETTEDPT